MKTISFRVETIELPVLKIDKIRAILKVRYNYTPADLDLSSCWSFWTSSGIKSYSEASELYNWFKKNNLV